MCFEWCQWICDCFSKKNERKKDKTRIKTMKSSKKHINTDKMDNSRSDKQEKHSNQQINRENSRYSSSMESYYKPAKVSTDSTKQAVRQPSVTLSQISVKDLTKEYKVPDKRNKSGFKTANDVLKYNNYKLDREIGRGGYGIVYIAYKIDPKTKQSEIMACKLIDLRKTKRHKLKSELFVFDKIKHENAIKLYDRFIINDYAYIFMEYADGKSMADEIKRGPLSNKTARRYFAQMISAVNFMHKKNICHRDLKLDNILLMNSKKNRAIKEVKISDFGMSIFPFNDRKSIIKSGRFAGTRAYMSPEIIRYEVYREYSRDPALKFSPFKADMWALGICLYEMLTTYTPFYSSNTTQMLADQENGNWSYPSSIKSKIDPKADNLIKLLLEPNSYKRVDSSFVMFHEWLKPEYDAEN